MIRLSTSKTSLCFGFLLVTALTLKPSSEGFSNYHLLQKDHQKQYGIDTSIPTIFNHLHRASSDWSFSQWIQGTKNNNQNEQSFNIAYIILAIAFVVLCCVALSFLIFCCIKKVKGKRRNDRQVNQTDTTNNAYNTGYNVGYNPTNHASNDYPNLY